MQIIATLLKSFTKITNDLHVLYHALPALKLLQTMLPRIKKSPNDNSYGRNSQILSNLNIANEKLVDSIDAFNDFFKRMSEKLRKQSKMRRNSPELETFKQAGEILVEI